MPLPTIQISQAAHATLRSLADEAGEPVTEVLDRAVEASRRERFLNALNDDFAALRADPEAWAAEQDERTAWDATLADALESRWHHPLGDPASSAAEERAGRDEQDAAEQGRDDRRGLRDDVLGVLRER